MAFPVGSWAWALGVLALIATPAHAGLSLEVVQAPKGLLEPDGAAQDLVLHAIIDCTSLALRARDPTTSTRLHVEIPNHEHVLVAGFEDQQVAAADCRDGTMVLVVRFGFQLQVAGLMPAFEWAELVFDASLDDVANDPATDSAVVRLRAAPMVLVEATTPQRQFLDDGTVMEPAITFRNLGNAPVTITVTGAPPLDGPAGTLVLEPRGEGTHAFRAQDVAPTEAAWVAATWSATVVVPDGAPEGPYATAEGESTWQIVPGRGPSKEEAWAFRFKVGSVVLAVLALAAAAIVWSIRTR